MSENATQCAVLHVQCFAVINVVMNIAKKHSPCSSCCRKIICLIARTCTDSRVVCQGMLIRSEIEHDHQQEF
jgi:hypothetical protein